MFYLRESVWNRLLEKKSLTTVLAFVLLDVLICMVVRSSLAFFRDVTQRCGANMVAFQCATKAPFTHSRFLATVPLRFAAICKIVVNRGVPW